MKEIGSTCVLGDAECERNLKINIARGLPYIRISPKRTDKLAIVAAGPSVKDFLPEIAQFENIWAINGAYDFLLEKGIVPNGFFGTDPLPGLVNYLTHPQKETTFYLSALCDPSVFEAVKDYNINVWFPGQDEFRFPCKVPEGGELTPGGTTALTRAPFAAKCLGFTNVTLFGADSSFNGSRYCYPYGKYAEDSKAAVKAVMINGEGPFYTEVPLMQQVSQLGVIFTHQTWGVKLDIRCHGLMDAYIRAPLETDI